MNPIYLLADRLRHRMRLRRWTPERAAGVRGEDLAHRYIRRLGFTVVARNYRARGGGAEADIIAWDDGTLVFVEVKSRATEAFGAPDRAVDERKRAQLARVAREYTTRANVDWNHIRFDIVNVINTAPPVIELIRDAFGHAPRV